MVTGYEGYAVPDEKYLAITTALVTSSGVRDVFVLEDSFALLATGSGVDVVDLQEGQVVSSGVIFGTEVTSVAATPTATGNVYVGTTTQGVYTVPWYAVRRLGADFSNQLQQTFTTSSTPSISANQVNDLDVVAGPYRLLVSTASGVDFITSDHLGATRPLESGSLRCQLTSVGEGYWTVVNSGAEASYDLNSASGTGIIVVDFEYNATASNPLLPSHVVNDLTVLEGSPNLLNFATSAGDFVVEEQQGSEATSQTKTPLAGDVVSAEFSQDATFDTSGMKYASTADSVSVVDMESDTISGTHYWTISEAEKFTKENTRDQALVTGTITVLRTTSVA
jgi:hypothetical protein